MTNHLLVEKRDGIARITFNRPDARNAVSIEMREALIDTMLDIATQNDIRCVLLRGAGKNFMAGGDVKSFVEFTEMAPLERKKHFEKRVNTLIPLLTTMQQMEKPIVAAVQGAAVGFGFSLAMACDLVVATDDARFACSYIGIGCSPDGSGSYYLPQLVGVKKAMELAMLGEFIDAQTAMSMGLINRIVAAEQLDTEVDSLLKRLANAPTVGLSNVKQLMYASMNNNLQTQMAMEAKCFADCVATEDWVEGVTAFVEKRGAHYSGK
jgi:2-(1,2-epoxy-1,2-dihydrophenyl)acetyl-CoA isomerase